jgi:hypothetical protein
MTLDRRQFLAGLPLLSAWSLHRPRPGAGSAHPHAALLVYTEARFRARHATVVAKALQQRWRAHTSGWQRVDGKPRLEVGPVSESAGQWHGDELVKAIDRTWPFVVVLEYHGEGAPEAYLDCFRRPVGQKGDDGWLLDPGVGYVEHHNAQIVTAQDDRSAYLAVPDTPTGSHVGGSEYVIRARVRWADGRRAQLGWWMSFDAPKGEDVARWRANQVSLVDWRVVASTPKLGATQVAPVDDPDRELAVWGTDRVLRFPAIPPGVTPGRGRI